MDILEFLHSFIPLINTHSNDFLITDLWENFLPDSVRLLLDNIESPEFILAQYLQCTENALQFNFQHVNADIDWNRLIDPAEGIVDRKLLPNWETVAFDLHNFIKTCARFSRFSAFNDVRNECLPDIFIDHEMNEKKSYEVKKMSHLCHQICEKYHITNIVDIGSGKGYLGSDLSLSKGFNVIELDSKQSNSVGALKRRQRYTAQLPSMKKKKNVPGNINAGNCRSIVRMIMATDTISQILVAEGVHDTDYLLTGLHCCGGLSSTVLKNFVNDTDSKAVAIVGCCYHLLNEQFIKNFPHDRLVPTHQEADFPMSATLRTTGIVLGRNAKTFASQSVKRVAKEGTLPVSMFHRVLLQKLIFDKLGYVSDDWIVGKIAGKKMANPNSFEEYARLSCDKLGFKEILDNMTSADFIRFENQFPHLQHRFKCFFYLKCCLSAIVENVIIWDRLLFLQENGISNARVLELFDEMRSPRRYAIVGVK